MENIITLLQAFHLNILEVIITSFFIFIVGYQYGSKRVRKLSEKIYGLQKDVLDLNAEIIFGKSEAPVIEIKKETLKANKLAR
jgi:hypothetical protein